MDRSYEKENPFDAFVAGSPKAHATIETEGLIDRTILKYQGGFTTAMLLGLDLFYVGRQKAEQAFNGITGADLKRDMIRDYGLDPDAAGYLILGHELAGMHEFTDRYETSLNLGPSTDKGAALKGYRLEAALATLADGFAGTVELETYRGPAIKAVNVGGEEIRVGPGFMRSKQVNPYTIKEGVNILKPNDRAVSRFHEQIQRYHFDIDPGHVKSFIIKDGPKTERYEFDIQRHINDCAERGLAAPASGFYLDFAMDDSTQTLKLNTFRDMQWEIDLQELPDETPVPTELRVVTDAIGT